VHATRTAASAAADMRALVIPSDIMNASPKVEAFPAF
jgi:hypothetical protein